MAHGTLLHLPFSGGVWDQPEGLLAMIEAARYAWYIFAYKPANQKPWTAEEAEYIQNLTEPHEQ